jgi:hypothetical protein
LVNNHNTFRVFSDKIAFFQTISFFVCRHKKRIPIKKSALRQ